jgi:site-specific DNA-cytosine methylase
MKLLELFAGSRSVGKVAEEYGWDVFSVDWEAYEGINLVTDIETLTPEQIPFVPDVIWMSPDCTSYSIAAISTHRNGTTPKSEYAIKCDSVNLNALSLMRHYLDLNPELKFFIENPVGMMRKMPFMQGVPRATVTYCQYGDTRMKPTDIWSNNIYSMFNPVGWMPKPRCKNGDKCHVSAPRGSKTGTQGLRGSYERSRIPRGLVEDVLGSCAIVAKEKRA